MKKIISVMLTAAMLLGFAACTPVSTDSIEPAVYRMHESQREPYLSLKEDGTFSLVHNSAAKDSTRGTYAVEDKVLILTAEDGSVYRFNIQRKALKFDADTSDSFNLAPEFDSGIVDGTKFTLWRTR